MASVLSLFSGCGGFDHGLASSGFDVVRAYDKSIDAVETYNINLRPVARVLDLRGQSVGVTRTDVVVAGPPCQGFSTIGSLRPEDERNNLLLDACEIALYQRPKIFVLENVPGLASSVHRSRLDGAMAKLSDAGYSVDRVVVKCEEHGLAQRRRRLFIVARSGNRPFQIALPSAARRTVGDALAQIRDPKSETAAVLESGTRARLIAERILEGQKLSDVRTSPSAVHTWQIPEVFGNTTLDERRLLECLSRLRRTNRVRATGDGDAVAVERLSESIGLSAERIACGLVDKGYLRKADGNYELKHTFNGSYRRLDRSAPSPTVDTHFGEPRLFLHPWEQRGMSYVEAAALQGFPEEFKWPVGRRARFRLIGNAVPPPISRQIANMVRELL